MKCGELQQRLPEMMAGRPSLEEQAHLRSCPECAGLVSDLNAIAEEARLLRAAEEPSPRVWNAIEVRLRQEGLIRPPQPTPERVPSFGKRWGWAGWLVPIAAALLIVVGVSVRQPSRTRQMADVQPPAQLEDVAYGGMDDDQLLQEVSAHAPMMRATYEQNLRNVNEYIRDAKSTLAEDPNDEEAREAVMEAYGQKAMLFRMALAPSLP